MDRPLTIDDSRGWLASALILVQDQRRALRLLVESAEALIRQRLDEEEGLLESLARVRRSVREAERPVVVDADAAAGSEAARLRLEERRLREQHQALLAEVTQLRRAGRRLELALQYTTAAASCLVPRSDEDERRPASTEERTMAVQEEERYRLARDLHDGPAQVLANAILELQYCQRLLTRDPKALRCELAQLEQSLRDGLAEVRRLLFDLRPPALADLGLQASLQRYVQEFRDRTGLDVQLAMDEMRERLTAAQEVAIFRIVQEALQNVRKHAKASKVAVKLQEKAGFWWISVEDNGVGFDPTRVRSGGKMTVGLESMHERARLVEAVLEVKSEPGVGTVVSLMVPRTPGGSVAPQTTRGRGNGEDKASDRR